MLVGAVHLTAIRCDQGHLGGKQSTLWGARTSSELIVLLRCAGPPLRLRLGAAQQRRCLATLGRRSHLSVRLIARVEEIVLVGARATATTTTTTTTTAAGDGIPVVVNP